MKQGNEPKSHILKIKRKRQLNNVTQKQRTSEYLKVTKDKHFSNFFFINKNNFNKKRKMEGGSLREFF